MIGAGSVVTNDIPNFALILGNPGVIVGWVDKKGNSLKFDDNGISFCREFEFNGKFVLFIGE